GAGDDDTLVSQRALADALMRRAQVEPLASAQLFEEAEALLSDAVSKWESARGQYDQRLLGTLNILAQFQRLNWEFAKSEHLYNDLITRAKTIYSPDHPILAVYQNNLAVCLIKQKKFAAAAPILRDIRPIFDRIGPEHPLTLIMKNNLASALDALGKHDEAN